MDRFIRRIRGLIGLGVFSGVVCVGALIATTLMVLDPPSVDAGAHTGAPTLSDPGAN